MKNIKIKLLNFMAILIKQENNLEKIKINWVEIPGF